MSAASPHPLRRLRAAASALALVFLLAPAVAKAESGTLAPPTTTSAGTVTGVSTSNPAAAPATYSTSGNTTTITLTSPRTIITFSAFNLPSASRLNFEFADRDDIVLLRVASGHATIGGTVRSFVGAVSSWGSGAGSVWVAAGGGAVFGPQSVVDAGGLLATTADVADADFFGDPWQPDDADTFEAAPPGSGVQIQSGASLTGNGGVLGFIAPVVAQAPGSLVSAAGVEGDSEVLYGSAEAYQLTFADDLWGDDDLLGMVIPGSGAASGSIQLDGSTRAGDIFVASVAEPSAPGPPIGARNLEAVQAADIGGNITVSAGGGLARADETQAMTATPQAGAAPQRVELGAIEAGRGVRATSNGAIEVGEHVLSYDEAVSLAAAGDIELGPDGRVSGDTVALATEARFVNGRGPDAVTATDRWAVYAPGPDGPVFGGLDSGNRAIWDADAEDAPLATLTGDRYVFRHSPTLTVTGRDAEKLRGDDIGGALGYDVTGEHPGVPGAFLGDAGAAYSGTPLLSSEGAGPGATVLGGPYPIHVARGSLSSDAGYGFAFGDSGRVTVVPRPEDTPPAVTPAISGTLGANGWYTSDVTLGWSVVDGTFETATTSGCGNLRITTDGTGHAATCTAASEGGTATATASVKRDATRPRIVAAATTGGAPYVPGTEASRDVEVRFDCVDGGSGVDAAATTLVRLQTVPAGGAAGSAASAGACVDRAGNAADAVTFGPIRFSPAPAVRQEAATSPSPAATLALLAGGAAKGATAVRKLGLRRFAATGYRRAFSAGQGGRATEEVLTATPRRRALVVVARGARVFAGAGSATLAVKPTKAGRTALRSKRVLKLVIRTTFRPASGGKPIVASRAVSVRR